MSDTKLLPCPFCGGAAYMAHERDADDLQWHYITCRKCGARSRGQWNSPGNDCPLLREEVRDEWNARAPANEQGGTSEEREATSASNEPNVKETVSLPSGQVASRLTDSKAGEEDDSEFDETGHCKACGQMWSGTL